MRISLEKGSSNSQEYNDELELHGSESAYQEYKAELELHGSQYMRLRKETDDFFAKKFQEIEKSHEQHEQFDLNHQVILERIRERKTQQKRKNLVVKEITSKISEIFKMIK